MKGSVRIRIEQREFVRDTGLATSAHLFGGA